MEANREQPFVPAEPAPQRPQTSTHPPAHPLGGFDLLSGAALGESHPQPAVGPAGVGVSVDSSEATLSSWAASPSQPLHESTAATGSRHFPAVSSSQDLARDPSAAQSRHEPQLAGAEGSSCLISACCLFCRHLVLNQAFEGC